jgi:short-subunit dehydrogenase
MPENIKRIIIIGASAGIGRALAIRYASAGYRVGISGRSQALLEEVANIFPGQIVWESFDVMSNDNLLQLQNLIAKLGGMDLLIYNAGYGEISESLDPGIDQQTIQTNVNGFATIVLFGYNYFLERGGGHIVATSSIAALAGNRLAPAYSASKAFISIYMEGLWMKARHLRKKGMPIFITDLQPGFVKTKMAKGPGRFWEAPPEKAAAQIFTAIEAKKFRVYITKRWALIAFLVRITPARLLRRLG